MAQAPAHLVGQSIGLPGCHLLLIVRIPKHTAQCGRVLQIEERPAVVMVAETRLVRGNVMGGAPIGWLRAQAGPWDLLEDAQDEE